VVCWGVFGAAFFFSCPVARLIYFQAVFIVQNII
jgi:hypothetical protein